MLFHLVMKIHGNIPPFSATIDGNKLYGRGSEDMKSNIACFISATEEFISKYGKRF